MLGFWADCLGGSATKEREMVGVGSESEGGGKVGGDGGDVAFAVSISVTPMVDGGAGDGGDETGAGTGTEADEAGERMGLAGSGWLEA